MAAGQRMHHRSGMFSRRHAQGSQISWNASLVWWNVVAQLGEVVDLRHVASGDGVHDLARLCEHGLQRGHDGGDLVIGDLRGTSSAMRCAACFMASPRPRRGPSLGALSNSSVAFSMPSWTSAQASASTDPRRRVRPSCWESPMPRSRRRPGSLCMRSAQDHDHRDVTAAIRRRIEAFIGFHPRRERDEPHRRKPAASPLSASSIGCNSFVNTPSKSASDTCGMFVRKVY